MHGAQRRDAIFEGRTQTRMSGVPEWVYVGAGAALGAGGGFVLGRGASPAVHAVYATGGVLAGFVAGDALYGYVNNKGGGGELRRYITMFTQHPFSSLAAFAGVTGGVFLLIQVFGGEIVDLIPGVDVLALPPEIGIGAVVAAVTLPVTEPIVHAAFDVLKHV